MNPVAEALQNAVSDTARHTPEPMPQGLDGEQQMLFAAKSWASYALANMVGKRLRLALAISQAIANYDALG